MDVEENTDPFSTTFEDAAEFNTQIISDTSPEEVTDEIGLDSDAIEYAVPVVILVEVFGHAVKQIGLESDALE
ncbi:MAG: hypothetical protein ACKPKO_57445, partial [Candidatus Fonsibacter sp.]